jgi:hypothetical protein
MRDAIARRSLWVSDLTPSIPALILAGHPAHGQQPGRFRFHQLLLQIMNGLLIATLAGVRDLLLYAYHLLLQGAPGQGILGLVRGRLDRLR